MEPYQIQNIVEMCIVSFTVVLLAFSPLPRALGRRLMHGQTQDPKAPPLSDPRLDDLLDENTMLRRQLDEVQERVAFTERMLAEQRHKSALPGS